MKLKHLAQSTVVLTSKAGSTLLVDPGQYNLEPGRLTAETFPTADLIVITHKHADHFDLELLQAMLSRSDPVIITNHELKDSLQKVGISASAVDVGDVLEEAGFHIRTTLTDHVVRGESIVNFGVIVSADEVTLYHPSDTRYIEPALLPEETKADCLLVPISDRGLVMGMDDALFFSHQLSPGLVIPIHYDGPKDRDRIDPEEFVTKAGQLGLRAQILSFGEEIEL